MKILLFSSVLKSENDEIHEFLYEIGSGMLKKGHEVMIVAAHKKGMSKRSEYNGIKIRRFSTFGLPRPSCLHMEVGWPRMLGKALLQRYSCCHTLPAGQ